MKKILLTMMLSALATYCLAQDNYFKDAQLLKSLKPYISQIKVVLDGDTLRLADPLADPFTPFINLLHQAQAVTGDAYAGNDTNTVNEGELVNANNQNETTPATETSLLKKAEEESALKKELLAAAWLLNNNSEVDLLAVSDFPKSFPMLKKIKSNIIEGGFGQSEGQPTNFAFSEAAIIYGVTDFIIKRAKEQLVEVYLEGWYDKLESDETLRQMLPQTLDVMNAFIQDNGISLAKYGDKWKVAMQEDIRNFPNLLQGETFVSNTMERLWPKMESTQRSEFVAAISGSAQLAYRIYMKEHAVNVINTMAANYYLPSKTGDKAPVFKRMMVLLQVLSEVAGTMSEKQTYTVVNISDARKMDLESWEILIKLIYTRNHLQLKYVFQNNKTFDNLTRSSLTDFNEFRLLLENGIAQFQNIQDLLSLEKGEKLSFEESRKLFESAFALFGTGNQFLLHYNIVKDDTFYQSFKQYSGFVTEMGEGISTQQYGKVLDGTIGVFNTVTKEYPSRLADTVTKNLQRYGSFMLNIIASKDAGQVEAALDELIPKGSYQLKNYKRTVVSLSAFPGVMFGGENIKKYPVDAGGAVIPGSKKEVQTKYSLAPYLPIGFDISFHVAGGEKLYQKAMKKKSGSMNIGIQLVDLGAVLNYRLSSDSTVETAPDVSWKQLFSPGLQLMWHFNNSPVVIGAACNYTPDLRKINQDGNTYSSNAFRFGIFLGVDVTFFNLFTSKKPSWGDYKP